LGFFFSFFLFIPSLITGKRAKKGRKISVEVVQLIKECISLVLTPPQTSIIIFHELRVSLFYSKYLKFCMQRARGCLLEHFHQICPKLPQFISFVWIKMKKKIKTWFTHTQDRLMRPLLSNVVKIHSMVNSVHPMMGQWFPSRNNRSLEQALWCPRSLGPGNPISLMKFASFPQSHLQLPQVKTITRLTRRWNRPFFKQSGLFSPWCYIATC